MFYQSGLQCPVLCRGVLGRERQAEGNSQTGQTGQASQQGDRDQEAGLGGSDGTDGIQSLHTHKRAVSAISFLSQTCNTDILKNSFIPRAIRLNNESVVYLSSKCKIYYCKRK